MKCRLLAFNIGLVVTFGLYVCSAGAQATFTIVSDYGILPTISGSIVAFTEIEGGKRDLNGDGDMVDWLAAYYDLDSGTTNLVDHRPGPDWLPRLYTNGAIIASEWQNRFWCACSRYLMGALSA